VPCENNQANAKELEKRPEKTAGSEGIALAQSLE